MFSILYHLFEYPLYEKETKDTTDTSSIINILILGFSKTCQEFLDASLQIGQIPHTRLNIRVLSDNNLTIGTYLKRRPELSSFFDVAQISQIDTATKLMAINNSDDSYGTLRFITYDFSRISSESNFLDHIGSEICSNYKPNYVFIDVGTDAFNYEIACSLNTFLYMTSCDASLSFAQYGDESEATPTKELSIHPFWVNAIAKKHPDYDVIERMGFNIHLLWKQSLNIDFPSARREYMKKYEHFSNISGVVSIKYKLHSIGIELEKLGFHEAARLYEDILLNRNNKGDTRKELIQSEHRRWVTEKICQGWSRINDLNDCLINGTKDERHKKHVCIRKSRVDSSLSDFKSYVDWDTASDEKLDTLDELDRMSVELHRLYRRKASPDSSNAPTTVPFPTHNLQAIFSHISLFPEMLGAYHEWQECLRKLYDGDKSCIKMYKFLKGKFLATTSILPASAKKAIRTECDDLENKLSPVLKSSEYRNWKESDTDIIDNVPFILTYPRELVLIVPCDFEELITATRLSKLFSNVAAATVLNPSRIIYLVEISKRTDKDELLTSFQRILTFLTRKNIRASLDIMLISKDSDKGHTKSVIDTLSHNLDVNLPSGKLRKLTVTALYIPMDNITSVEVVIRLTGNYPCNKSGTSPSPEDLLIAIERNHTPLSRSLEANPSSTLVYNGSNTTAPLKPYSYSFDATNMTFNGYDDCIFFKHMNNMLQGIHGKRSIFSPCLTVGDIAALSGSSGKSSMPEFYVDYMKLWETYKKNIKTWKYLCDLLGKYDAGDSRNGDTSTRNHKAIIAFFHKANKRTQSNHYSAILPTACEQALSKILSKLKEHNLVERSSEIIPFSSEAFRVNIVSYYSIDIGLSNLLSNIQALIRPDAISIQYDTNSDRLNVRYDDLTVTDFILSVPRTSVQMSRVNLRDLKNLLNYFQTMGYLVGVSQKPERSTNARNGINDENEKINCSFLYGSTQIKQLLTSAGRMLEVYVYYKLRESGYFDDIVSSYSLSWENGTVQNEFDLILTKGFRSMVVECKARENPKSEFYDKLENISKLGINQKSVLLIDTNKKPESVTSESETHYLNQDRQHHTTTVWRHNEIENIGDTLKAIMEGTYVNNIRGQR